MLTRHKETQRQDRGCVSGDTSRGEEKKKEEGRESSPLPQGVPDSVQVLSLLLPRHRKIRTMQKKEKKKDLLENSLSVRLEIADWTTHGLTSLAGWGRKKKL